MCDNHRGLKIAIGLLKKLLRIFASSTRLNPTGKNPLGNTAHLALMVLLPLAVDDEALIRKLDHLRAPVFYIAQAMRGRRPLSGEQLIHIFDRCKTRVQCLHPATVV